MLESFKHGDSSFITLTYDDDHLPDGGTLVPKHVQDWLKRLRSAIYPRQIRYYLAGEYGEETWRPHYHAIVFGLSPTVDGGIVQATWDQGHSMCGFLTPASAAYVAGYVTKKLTKDPVNLAGRHPEFQRMSLKPGIGALAVEDIGKVCATDAGLDHIAAMGDVPFQLMYGRKGMLLGKYLRRKLRENLGFASENIPPEALEAFKLEMRKLYEDNVKDKVPTAEGRRAQWKMKFLDMSTQMLRNSAKRSEIHRQRKEI